MRHLLIPQALHSCSPPFAQDLTIPKLTNKDGSVTFVVDTQRRQFPFGGNHSSIVAMWLKKMLLLPRVQQIGFRGRHGILTVQEGPDLRTVTRYAVVAHDLISMVRCDGTMHNHLLTFALIAMRKESVLPLRAQLRSLLHQHRRLQCLRK